MSHIPLFRITHHFSLPKQLGGGKGHAKLGMFVVFGDGDMLEVLPKTGGPEANFGRSMPKPKGDDYKFELVTNPEDFLDLTEAEKAGAVEFGEWLDYMEPYYLTIRDIEALEPGETIQVVQLHRNLGDIVCDSSERPYGKPFEASVFFKDVIGTYTHEKDLHGHMKDEYYDGPFNFDLNYRGKSWYPLGDDGLLPVKTGEASVRGAVADYRQYPKTTKVGWRGPMLFVGDLEDAPKVYHEEQKWCTF